ncbi:DNA mismatch repair protein MutL [Halovenus aranensis]|jgi:DNA mismatch repair protein MutL|uniref:DNA mismatch repair protein MutL n=1 Tax=Halovenus aranensis TaxID=890420 RepID=A0A1G8YYU6_9EURY|nr:DNA mismatch repair endonuclease MutL [Halovenus aranensis]SDK07951.1 DNA mismatch repair protein MutL [Halovenus aranensis]
MTASEIRELDPQTVERIAAGEVVERPASAVKELIENSIDADASRVTVAVENGGIDGIRVRDDGVGMARGELERAVDEHTTSKIADIDDLESGVATLGFRGEALHAIGAVSRLTITTRPRAGGEATELTVAGGNVTDVRPAGHPSGTTVEVDDLFYNVPARQKYLKQPSTEFDHVNTVTTSYALANPDVAVTLEHDDRETFATTGSGDLQETVMAVYGREVAQAMRTVSGEDIPDGPLDSVRGLVSHPETNRASREYLSTFVNGRYVTASVAREAVVDAYDTQLAPDRYPFAVLFLEVDPATVDVNVHPRKMEVRFADEAAVKKQVEHAVEQALLEEGLVRTSAPRGRSAPDQTEIQPDTTEPETDEPETQQNITSRRDDGPDEPDRQQRTTSRRGDNSETGASTSIEAGPSAAGDSTDTRSQGSSDTEEIASNDTSERDDDRRKFQDTGTQSRLTASTETEQFESLPSMRVLGQYQETYIVAETTDGLVLVDQHAADERINYERLREDFSGETTTQALAEPVELELTAREAELFDSHTDALARLGFRARLVGDRTVEVQTVPTMVAGSAGPALIRDVLSEFVQGRKRAADTVEAAVDDLLADLACYPSITGNTSLTEGSVVDLLARLDSCENPYACPHGRPVVVEFDTEEIENRFERDYPGHQ